MRIESHGFGNMVIDGRTYTSDLVIDPDGKISDHWRRRRGHVLAAEDLAGLIAAAPEVIVAGAGVNGMMKPDPGAVKFFTRRISTKFADFWTDTCRPLADKRRS